MFKIELFTTGYKYEKGIKTDMLFDVRILPNPYYIESLKDKDGYNDMVYDYVINNDIAKIYLEKMVVLLETFITFRKNDVDRISITIACTGGQHRSVAVARYLKKVLPYEVTINQ